MQYYTKQQLQGSIRFSPSCLVGNWIEDVEIQDTKLKDFLLRKETSSLRVDEFQRRMATALQHFELTKTRDDEFVHFGDLLQLQHVCTGVVLSGDIHDMDTRADEESCAVTGSSALPFPCARNTFILTKYKPNNHSVHDTYFEDDVLRLGQKIRIAANPAIYGGQLNMNGGRRPWFLFSCPLSTTHMAKHSRQQLVGLTPRISYESVWEIRPTDPEDWVAMQGEKVKAMEALTIVHCSTKQALMLEDAIHINDFGAEQEVSAHSIVTMAKREVLYHSMKGELRRTSTKPVKSQNHWQFVTGSKIGSLPTTDIPSERLMQLLGTMVDLLQKSTEGYQGIHKRLLLMDKNGTGSVLKEEFLICLEYAGIHIEEADTNLLMDFFSSPQTGCIDVRAFLTELKRFGKC